MLHRAVNRFAWFARRSQGRRRGDFRDVCPMPQLVVLSTPLATGGSAPRLCDRKMYVVFSQYFLSHHHPDGI